MEFRRNYTYLLLIGFFALACTEIKNEKALSKKPYFDLEGFVEGQISYLDSLSGLNDKAPVVKRTIAIEGEKETVTLTKEGAEAYPNWKKELLLFKESDINKPVLLQSYEEVKTDSSSIFSAKENSLKVQELEVVYSGEEVAKIYIELNEENYLYTSDKSMYLTVKNGYLDQYAINGYRKLIANDALNYKVTTQLSYP